MQTRTAPKSPRELRRLIRNGEWSQPTPGLASGYVQANLAVLPKELAFDFLLYCQRNPQPCPVIEVVEAGSAEPKQVAPGADLRTDLPKYLVYEHGEMVAEVDDIQEYWRDDLVSFLLGCSFSFQMALVHAGIPVPHLDEGKSDPTYITTLETKTAGIFSGPMVVSMWPIPWSEVSRVVQITSRLPGLHGAPVHIGDPAAIGIQDLGRADYGDVVELKDGDVPVFWGCGVTPQAAAMRSKPPMMLTHSAGHMFITDQRYQKLAVL